MAKLIIFDAGNTLVWLDHAFLARLVREHGIEASDEEVLAAEYEGKLLLDELARTEPGQTQNELARRYFMEIFRRLGVPEEALPELEHRLTERHRERHLWSTVRPGTIEALGELKRRGYRLGVISNADGGAEALLETVGLAPFFDFIIDSTVVGLDKPDPRIFRLGYERGGADPEEAVYVGDIYEVDIVGARAVGMRAFLVDPLQRFTDYDCERITGVDELPERLAGVAESGARGEPRTHQRP